MKSVKKKLQKYPGDGRPTFVYDDGDCIVKEIPLSKDYEGSRNIGNQIKLINSVLDFNLIYPDYQVEEKPNYIWQDGSGYKSNLFLRYKMKKIPYVYDLEKNIPHERGPNVVLPQLYKDPDLYLKHILARYIELNIKLHPYHNVDNGHGQLLQYDIGKPIIIDWDDTILGHKHHPQETGSLSIKWAVESVGLLKLNFGKENIIRLYEKTFNFYKELTYNTVLQDCNIDIDEMSAQSYKRLSNEIN
tara:strand:+ start:1023 stop:1757 length:735 start_codon:yes stop_codon:yes gene_type:complete